ncbi:thioredoxin [Haloglycomyces albus]|uniref:thioredoxin n=1 Tax=Haloglycomyces albus TaxID=526067 RepID=UPI00046CE4D8|nr:thioredoxin [Haloglycomyces albus]
MATVELTKENFEEIITTKDMVLVDWWAEWCGPCKQFAPVYEKSSEDHEDIVFGKIDTEAQQELASAADIQSIPTLMAFREGILLYSNPGAIPSEALEDLIGQMKALDMDDVRKQIADQEEEE